MTHGRRRTAAVFAAGLSLAAMARAQAPPGAAPRFPAATELIEVEVIVTDGKGVPILDLKKEDFALLEEGRPQTITQFTLRQTPRAAQRAAATPATAAASPATPSTAPALEVNARHIVIAVDDLHLAGENLLRAKQTLSRFVEEQLEPAARADGKEAAAGGSSPRLQEGLVSVFPRRDVPLVLAAGFVDAPGEGPVAMLSAEVDVSRLSFERDGDLRRATLELAGLIFDERGGRRAASTIDAS